MGLPDIPPGIETQANARFTEFLAAIGTRQTDYLAAHGRYYQGILTGLPENGNAAVPDRTKKPTDQAEDWVAFGITLPNGNGASVIGYGFDAYTAGYVAFGEIKIAGQTWRRQTDFGGGMETFDWTEFGIGA